MKRLTCFTRANYGEWDSTKKAFLLDKNLLPGLYFVRVKEGSDTFTTFLFSRGAGQNYSSAIVDYNDRASVLFVDYDNSYDNLIHVGELPDYAEGMFGEGAIIYLDKLELPLVPMEE